MKRKQLTHMVLLALFSALIVLLGSTPLGLIPLGFINVTILCVPVIIGSLLLGWRSGLILGLAFGLMSVFSAFTKPSALVATLMGASPVLMIIMSIVPRLLVPLVACGLYRLLEKRTKAAAAVAAACGSLTNTVFYLGLMLLFYVLCGIDTAEVLVFIGGTALIAGSLEALANGVICSAAMAALTKLNRKMQ